jgi:hypothetical protein
MFRETRIRSPNLLLWLPFIAGVLPLIAMFGAFALGVAFEVLPNCNPIIDGCRSISATGRKPPGSFLFRAIMLPHGIVLGFVWYLSVLWLCKLEPAPRNATCSLILVAGLINVVALIVYVTFLGTTEPVYEFMRRTGIYFGFLGMAVAQLAIAFVLLRTELRSLAKAMLTIGAVVFVLGVLNLVLKSVLDDPDAAENRIEWIATIIMQAWFFILFVAWRRTDAKFSVRIRPA